MGLTAVTTPLPMSKEARPRINPKLWVVVQLGAVRTNSSTTAWLADAIYEKAQREGITLAFELADQRSA